MSKEKKVNMQTPHRGPGNMKDPVALRREPLRFRDLTNCTSRANPQT